MDSLSSRTEDRIRELKESLVLQVYLGKGSFWEEVRAARIRWGIKPEVCLPPPKLPVPEQAKGDPEKEHQWWSETIKYIRLGHCGRERHYQASDWDTFVGACVLYDPPDLKLKEFAEYGNLEEAHIATLPIKQVPKWPWKALRDQEFFYRELIARLGERYIEPHGRNTAKAVDEIIQESDLLQEMRATTQNIETEEVITVDKDTNDDDVEDAARRIRATLEKDPGGAPPRDKLLAIKCAALYHDYNYRDPEDKRIKRWTHPRLAKEIIFSDPSYRRRPKNPKRVGEEFVKLGEELRKQHKKNRGTKTYPVV